MFTIYNLFVYMLDRGGSRKFGPGGGGGKQIGGTLTRRAGHGPLGPPMVDPPLISLDKNYWTLIKKITGQ